MAANKRSGGTRTNTKRTGSQPRKNTSAKKTSGKTSNTKTAKKTQRKTADTKNRKSPARQKNSLAREIAFLFILMFGILAMMSVLHMCGIFGEKLSAILFGLMGIMAYIFPVYLIVASGFYISNPHNDKLRNKIFMSVGLFIALCGLIQWIAGPLAKDIWQLYTVCSDKQSGGGFLGGLLAFELARYLGRGGALIVILALIVLFFILISGALIFTMLGRYCREKEREQRAARAEREKYITYEEETDPYEEDYYVPQMPSRKRRRARKKGFEVPVVGPEGEPAEAVSMEMEEAEKRKCRLGKKKSGRSLEEIIPDTEALERETSGLFGESSDIMQTSDPVPAAAEPEDAMQDLSDIQIFRSETAVEEADSAEEKPESDIYKKELNRKFGGEDAQEAALYLDPVSATPAAAADISTAGRAVAEGVMAGASMADGPAETGMQAQKKERKDAGTDQKDMEQMKEDLSKAAVKEIPYQFPSLDLLTRPKTGKSGMDNDKLRETALKLQNTLKSFGVQVRMGDISLGPSVTQYEIIPEMGVKVSKITSLADDIKLALAASDIRIEAPIPGKAAVGIEVPNPERTMVTLRELLESKEFKTAKSKVTFAVGKDISGRTIVTDIAKMPHLLIAGATGSGKSVLINTLIMSIIYKADPNDVKMIMVDPKMVELTAYEDIPHLMIPVVKDPKKASAALAWAVAEMTTRYQKFADAGVRDIASYNARIAKVADKNDPEYQKMPQIVIIVDEFADLMMVAPGEVEDAVCRLAQLARAAGIHLVLATQRPSVNVITGLIKANIPSRIALSVSSAVDSRTIIDSGGAEKLLGNGDMLFAPQNLPNPIRVQGAFVSDEERDGVVNFLKNNSNGPAYNDAVTSQIDAAKMTAGKGGGAGSGPDQDELFADAGYFIIEKDKASIGLLQRMFRIGFNRAARIMDQLSDAGVVGPEEGTKARQILMSREQFENYLEENG